MEPGISAELCGILSVIEVRKKQFGIKLFITLVYLIAESAVICRICNNSADIVFFQGVASDSEAVIENPAGNLSVDAVVF